LRDFFYNKSDLLVALAIILVAAIVILSRVNAIMNYPDTRETEAKTAQSAQSDDVSAVDETEVTDELVATDESIAQDNAAGADEQTAQQEPPATVEFIISAGESAGKIAENLHAQGLIEDESGFLAELVAQGADTKLKIGTFTIPSGASVSEIIQILISYYPGSEQ